MNCKFSRVTAIVAGIGLVAIGAALGVYAQEKPQIKRNIVLKEDMSIPGREAVMVLVELPPGAAEGRHTHAAEVYAFVLEGAVTQEVEGSPAVILKAGDVFHVAPGVVHEATNHGSVTAKLAAVFVAEKGKPLTTPAP